MRCHKSYGWVLRPHVATDGRLVCQSVISNLWTRCCQHATSIHIDLLRKRYYRAVLVRFVIRSQLRVLPPFCKDSIGLVHTYIHHTSVLFQALGPYTHNTHNTQWRTHTRCVGRVHTPCQKYGYSIMQKADF